MSEQTDFEICGWLRADRLRAVHPPKTTTDEECVQTERTERRRHADEQLEPYGIYEELEIEIRLLGQIISD